MTYIAYFSVSASDALIQGLHSVSNSDNKPTKSETRRESLLFPAIDRDGRREPFNEQLNIRLVDTEPAMTRPCIRLAQSDLVARPTVGVRSGEQPAKSRANCPAFDTSAAFPFQRRRRCGIPAASKASAPPSRPSVAPVSGTPGVCGVTSVMATPSIFAAQPCWEAKLSL